ncbi:ATP-binding protein [Candidatus Dependentiae bacterium]
MIQPAIRKRFHILGISIFALFVTSWFELFLQKNQDLIGAGINRTFFFLLINVHIVVIIVLLYLIIRQSIKLFVELHRQTPGSAFKKNLLVAFTVFSVIPSFLVFFVAGKLITTSIDNWFNSRISSGFSNSLHLHEIHTQKQRKILQNKAHFWLKKISRKNESILNQKTYNIHSLLKENFDIKFENKSNTCNDKIYLWHKNGDEIFGNIKDEINIWRSYRKFNDRSSYSLKKKFLNKISSLKDKEQVFDFYGSLYFIKKIQKSDLFDFGINKSAFFVFAHRYDADIRYALIDIQNSIDDYKQLKTMHNPIYWSYLFTFILVTLLILFLSIWCAFYLARGISKPIRELLRAMEKVRRGDLDVQVEYDHNSDLKNLAYGFNEMTKRLRFAHNQLEIKNKEMLMTLEHIKEAVFFVNKFGRILDYNSASKVLVKKYLGLNRFKNKKINFLGSKVKNTFFKLIRRLLSSDKKQLTKEITFTINSQEKILLINLTYVNNSLTNSSFKKTENGLLVIIEDLTDIVKINKIKTWQEAAKQMAHEIKNPLTPIQLATQRLKRKFRKSLNEDKVFFECTNTILNQVTIIKDLVTHFSEFAKMPAGNCESLDINKVIREITCLYDLSYPEIYFIHELQEFIPLVKVDKQQIKRVLVNLLDNSVRVLKQKDEKTFDANVTLARKCEKWIKIRTRFKTGRNLLEILVIDNGPGIPNHVKDKLFIPYVSTQKKNMGLGLAIVHESVDQMGGKIKLLKSDLGASFQILLPV